MDGDADVFDLLNAGDLDSDGLADTLLPAKWYGPAGTAMGVVVFGSTLEPGGPQAFADVPLRFVSERGPADYGYRLVLAGDVNGDSRADVAIAGPGDDATGTDAGSVAMFPLPH